MKHTSLPFYIRTSPLAIADAYKESHPEQYDKKITWVFSNFTPRKSRWKGMDKFVWFNLQAFLLKMNQRFKEDFFDLPEEVAVGEFADFYLGYFGILNTEMVERVRRLHQYGTIPLKIRSLKEGTAVPHNVPTLTIENTDPDFYWFTNFVETWMSCELWQPCTTATTAWYFKKLLRQYATLTGGPLWFVDFQGHDFSMRGMPGVEAAAASGAGHALSFKGSDTCPAWFYAKKYYSKDGKAVKEDECLITSVKATEHSVASASILLEMQDGSKDLTQCESELILRLLREVYPTGIVSYVSDTFDFWNLVTNVLRSPDVFSTIMNRDGKLVIRPDSGDPYKIICGDSESLLHSAQRKGLVECLWDIFGGTTNELGYKELDSHIGAIYGDSITLELAERIVKGLMQKGFASTNLVLGIGSYTYQYVTRDTHGIAIKATAVGIGWEDLGDGSPETIVPIFKDPKTDLGGKKSAKGLLLVAKCPVNGYALHQFNSQSELNLAISNGLVDEMEDVYFEGNLLRFQTFGEVREVLEAHT